MTLVGDHRFPPRGQSAITAAAEPVRITPQGEIKLKGAHRATNERLWLYSRDINIVHFGMQFKRSATMRAKFFPARNSRDPNSEPEPLDPDKLSPDDKRAIEVFNLLDAGRGRIAEVLADLVVNLEVTGIGHPVYQLRRTTPTETEDRFVVYSTSELQKEANGRWGRRNEDGSGVADSWGFTPADLVGVVWRPSNERRNSPDSPLRSVSRECELLLAMGDVFQASLYSRVGAGLLIIPDELIPPPNSDPGEVPLPGLKADINPLLEDIYEALAAPIGNPRHPNAVMPYLMSGPGDLLAKIQHVSLGRPTTREDLVLRDELRAQVVLGMDLPSAMITGLEQANHWGAWQIDAAAYRQHVDPPVKIAADGISRQVYWPLLAAAGVADPEGYVIWRNIDHLTASADRVADALLLHERRIIGDDPVLRVAGYDETDKPKEGDSNFGPPPPPPALNPPPVAEDPGPARSPAPGEEQEAAAIGWTPRQIWHDVLAQAEMSSLVANAKEEARLRTDQLAIVAATHRISGRGLADIDGGLSLRLGQAAKAAQQRALDRAGARIRTRAKKDQAMSTLIDRIPNDEVAMTVGRARLERMGVNPDELVTRDDFKPLEADSRRMLDVAIEASAEEVARLTETEPARDPTEERDSTDAAVDLLIAAVLAATLSRLFTPDASPDPADTGEIPEAGTLPGQAILDTMTTAGGGYAGTLPLESTFDVGVGNGPRTVQQLRDAGIVTTAYRWVYGDRGARARNFKPHLSLDGIEFDRWDDPALQTWRPFPRGGRYHPQDHAGCLCRYERTLWRLDQ